MDLWRSYGRVSLKRQRAIGYSGTVCFSSADRRDINKKGWYVAVFSSPLWNLASGGRKCDRPVTKSGFQLVPVDGGCLLPLPLGETVIGRSSFLGVSVTAVRQRSASLP